MKIDNLENLERAVDAFLPRETALTPERIRELIESFRVMPMCSVSDDEAEFLARRLEARHDISMAIGAVLTERNHKPWLEDSLASIDFYYWSRYRKLLESKQLSAQVIAALHEDTSRTLGLLENPAKEGPWSRRGMVVGHVQSGKTANYIGLICKAADAGYRLIVVIAGVHNNLRNQTQKRIDEGFVGRDSARLLSQREERYIGVGRIDSRRRPVTFTNSVKDFSKEMATGVGVPLHNLNEPVVFVVKKHSSTLKNLLEWLREHNASRGGKTVDEPMLLIDDEADNASINVKYGKGEVTRINSQIRELLATFSRSCYVGYTATPFANIFIDPDTNDEMLGADLFPRHFIVSLDPPSNYFGAERVFRDDAKSIVRHIDDVDDILPLNHAKEHALAVLPESLVRAVRTFVVARAIRLTRRQQSQHCSMLVNASRFTGMHGQIRNGIQNLLEDLRASVRLNAALPVNAALRDPEIARLHAVWQEEFGTNATWQDVQSALLDSVSAIKVVEVNSRSPGTLNYDAYEETGLSVIAVGGYSLSRGLTLEGLMVSYFLRNSMMYDTLMQMGRWFGYRDGYDDLCRVWLPEDAEGWYAHIAESIEMLREELRLMAAAGATPEEFGLKVRAHPDTLIVTARNKMGSGEEITWSVGLDNQFVETTTLKNDPASRTTNRRVLQHLADMLSEAGMPFSKASRTEAGWLLCGVPAAPIRSFIASFENHPLSLVTAPGPIGRYVADREDSELARWDVLVASVQEDDAAMIDSSLGIAVLCQTRTAGHKSDAATLRVSNRARLASRGVEKAGLSRMAIAEAEADYRRDSNRNDGDHKNFPDWIYRAKRERPLLIIHLLKMLTADRSGTSMYEDPVVAWSISFPKTTKPESLVEYVVTTTWLKENARQSDDDELVSDEF
jgi:hypothetical protein